MRSRKNLLGALQGQILGPREASVLICGGPGAGKSWMLEQLARQLPQQPHLLLRASPGESQWPLSGVLLLLSGLPVDEPIDLEPFLTGRGTEPVDSYAVARHLQQVFAQRLAPGLVVLIDDLDVMDHASRQVIGFLAGKLQRSRITFVATAGGDPLPTELGALQPLRLRPLTAAESLQLAREHAGEAADASVLGMLAAHAHGVPGALINQLGLLSTRQVRGQSPLSLPLRPTASGTAQLATLRAQLTPAQLRLLHHAALGPTSERAALLELGSDPDDLDGLIHQGLLEPVDQQLQLADDVLRSALYWSLDDQERRHLHGRLQDAGSSQALHCFHRSFAHGNRVSTVELLGHAAEFARGGQAAGAVELAERALGLTSAGPGLPAALALLAERLFVAMQLESAARYLRRAEALDPEPATSLHLAALRVQLAAVAGQPVPEVRPTDLLRRHGQDHAAAGGQLLATIACAHALRGEAAAGRQACQQAEQLLDGTGQEPPVRLEQARILVASTEQDHTQVQAAHQRLRGEPGWDRDAPMRRVLALALANLGHHQTAREVLARLAPDSEAASPLAQRLTLLLTAASACQDRDLPRGLTLAERWMAADGPALLQPVPQLIQAWYWMHKDRQDMFDAALADLSPHRLGELSGRDQARVWQLNAENDLLRQRPERAVQAYGRALHAHSGPPDLHFVRATAGLVEALVMLGRREQAVAEYRVRQQALSSVPGRRARLTMRLAHALVLDPEASLARFQALIDEWTPADNGFELARIRHALGHRLRALGRTEGAREHLLAARSLYRSLGARGWAAHVQQNLAARTQLERGNGAVQLSPEEFEVVRMVHRGLTNKAIAGELYISVSAVEARLTKLYRRTGAKNRQQLAARFIDARGSVPAE